MIKKKDIIKNLGLVLFQSFFKVLQSLIKQSMHLSYIIELCREWFDIIGNTKFRDCFLSTKPLLKLWIKCTVDIFTDFVYGGSCGTMYQQHGNGRRSFHVNSCDSSLTFKGRIYIIIQVLWYFYIILLSSTPFNIYSIKQIFSCDVFPPYFPHVCM